MPFPNEISKSLRLEVEIKLEVGLGLGLGTGYWEWVQGTRNTQIVEQSWNHVLLPLDRLLLDFAS